MIHYYYSVTFPTCLKLYTYIPLDWYKTRFPLGVTIHLGVTTISTKRYFPTERASLTNVLSCVNGQLCQIHVLILASLTEAAAVLLYTDSASWHPTSNCSSSY